MKIGGENMKKTGFTIFLMTVLVLVGCTPVAYSTDRDTYVLYFEDDFSGEDKHWITSQCSTAEQRDSRCFTDNEPDMEAECGVDSETQTFREKFIDTPTCGFSHYNFLYENTEYGDKIEFDFIVTQHESGNPICEMDMAGFAWEEVPEEGTYHIVGTFDRDYFRQEMTYPNGSVQEIETLVYHMSSATIKDLITDMSIPGITVNEGCAVDNRIDNLKIYKKSDTEWGLIQDLTRRVDSIASRVSWLMDRVDAIWLEVFEEGSPNNIGISP
jgi:hypothetical protein